MLKIYDQTFRTCLLLFKTKSELSGERTGSKSFRILRWAWTRWGSMNCWNSGNTVIIISFWDIGQPVLLLSLWTLDIRWECTPPTTAIHKSRDFLISGCRAYTPSKITTPHSSDTWSSLNPFLVQFSKSKDGTFVFLLFLTSSIFCEKKRNLWQGY